MEKTETNTEQSQAVISGMDRLTEVESPETEIITEAKPGEATELKPTDTNIAEKPAENKPEEEKPGEAKTEPVEPVEEVGFSDEPSGEVEDNGSWKSLIQTFGYELPADYSEEKGFEVLQQLKQQEIESKLEEVRNFKLSDFYADLPDNTRAEAQLAFELMKTGMTLEEINAPFLQLKEWKGMPKEQLVRLNYEREEGMTQELVDFRMEQLAEGNKMDLAYNNIILGLNKYEKSLTEQRQGQIQEFNNSQNYIREQKRLQDFQSIKTALDRMPTFMDKKVSEENKQAVLKEYQEGAFDKLTAVEKAELMMYRKYGKQGVQYLQSRAVENATREKAKSQHNIPITTTSGNRVDTTQHKSGMSRLEAGG